MRTTLDVDDRILAAAKSRARARRITVGQALSELALKGYEVEAGDEAKADIGGDIVMLPRVSGHVITDEMVERALADE